MNKILTVILALFASATGFAQVVSLATMRQDLQTQYKKAPELTKDCAQVQTNMDQTREYLRNLAQQVNSLRDDQNPRVIEALHNIHKAYTIVGEAERDCKNKLNHASLLLEIYLMHTDRALMEYRYGVGPDLRRVRN